MVDILVGDSTLVFDSVYSLHNMRSSHGSSVLDCIVWAGWDLLVIVL